MKKIDIEKLTIPIYLNTKIVFDMLATMEDGFSTVKNVETAESKGKEATVGAEIGTGNIFAMLNIALSGKKKTDKNSSEIITEERIHTTVSLFQKLKFTLDEADLINRDLSKCKVGDFLEISGILKTNPLIDMLQGLKELMALANIFSDEKQNGKKSKYQKTIEDKKFNSQIDALIKGLQTDGQKDIICKTDKITIIMPTYENYFFNNSMNELTDGEYKVLGKVIKICTDNDEGISLLRNTALSKLKLDKMAEFQNFFKDPSLAPLTGGKEIKTEINAPAMMMIPIAIYV